jgi:hypothetical protein
MNVKQAQNVGYTVPEVFITKNKQRVKQYDETVYLKDGDEFELELFNPASKKILAKISINGSYLGSGIILRPGERVFLERHLNESKKFVFSTYEVDGSNKQVLKAIQENGKVEVNFHEEQIIQQLDYNNIWVYNPSIYYCNGTGQAPICGGGTFTTNNSNFSTTSIGNDQNCSYTAGVDFSSECNASVDGVKSFSSEERPIETGRVEKGEHSDQSFEYDNTSFNTWSSWTQEWKILPMSQKVYVKEELKVFCTECGAKRKKDSFKFCPHCGTKY